MMTPMTHITAPTDAASTRVAAACVRGMEAASLSVHSCGWWFGYGYFSQEPFRH